jgi:hypothetical protein
MPAAENEVEVHLRRAENGLFSNPAMLTLCQCEVHSHHDPLREPLPPAEARRLLRAILADGEVVFTNHALEEMDQDGISQAEAIGALRSGVVEPAELERGPGGTASAPTVRTS